MSALCRTARGGAEAPEIDGLRAVSPISAIAAERSRESRDLRPLRTLPRGSEVAGDQDRASKFSQVHTCQRQKISGVQRSLLRAPPARYYARRIGWGSTLRKSLAAVIRRAGGYLTGRACRKEHFGNGMKGPDGQGCVFLGRGGAIAIGALK